MEVKQLELTDDLVNEYGILEVYYDSYKIETTYCRRDGQNDTITIPVLEYAHDTLQQLDSLVNGSMSAGAFTQLKYYLTLKLTPIWDEIFSHGNGNDTRNPIR